MPLLDGTAASFTCRNVHRFPGGDHLIFVGEVVALEQSARAPLVYANGGYAELHDDANARKSFQYPRTSSPRAEPSGRTTARARIA